MMDSNGYSVYHLPCSDDSAAIRLFNHIGEDVCARGGRIGIAYSHSHGPAYVTLELPEGVSPYDFPGVEVTPEPVGQSHQQVTPGSTDLDGLTEVVEVDSRDDND